MPKSVQFRPEPDFSTPPVVPRSAGFAAGDSSPGAAVDLRKQLERTPVQVRRSGSQSVAVIFGKGVAKAGVLLYREPLSRPAATLSPPSGERAGRGDQSARFVRLNSKSVKVRQTDTGQTTGQNGMQRL